MNRLIQEKNNRSETLITVKVSRRPQKVKKREIHLANEQSGLAFLIQTQIMFLEAMLALTSEFG